MPEDRGLLSASVLYRDHYSIGRLRSLLDERPAIGKVSSESPGCLCDGSPELGLVNYGAADIAKLKGDLGFAALGPQKDG